MERFLEKDNDRVEIDTYRAHQAEDQFGGGCKWQCIIRHAIHRPFEPELQ